MIKIILPIVFIVLTALKINSQTELRISAGLSDYPGVSVEQMYRNFGVELSGSFRRKDQQTEWHGPATNRTDKSFLNLAFKAYVQKDDQTGAFVGCYMRLRTRNTYLVDPFTAQRLAFADTIGQPVGYATRSDKFSIGGLVGYKWLFGDHLVMEMNLGLGFAPYYKFTDKQFNYPDKKYNYQGDEFTGSIEKMSIYGHFIIGYRF